MDKKTETALVGGGALLAIVAVYFLTRPPVASVSTAPGNQLPGLSGTAANPATYTPAVFNFPALPAPVALAPYVPPSPPVITTNNYYAAGSVPPTGNPPSGTGSADGVTPACGGNCGGCGGASQCSQPTTFFGSPSSQAAGMSAAVANAAQGINGLAVDLAQRAAWQSANDNPTLSGPVTTMDQFNGAAVKIWTALSMASAVLSKAQGNK